MHSASNVLKELTATSSAQTIDRLSVTNASTPGPDGLLINARFAPNLPGQIQKSTDFQQKNVAFVQLKSPGGGPGLS